MFLLFLVAQTLTGALERREQGDAPLGMADYLSSSGHFIEATAENWESEFLQMAAYVLAWH